MTLSQVISFLKCFHPYEEQSHDSHQTNLGHSKKLFFKVALLEKLDFRQSQSSASRFQHQ